MIRAVSEEVEHILERIPILICGCNRCADVCIGSRVFRYRARRDDALREHRWMLIDIGDIDRDGDGITPAIAIRDRNRHRVGVLRFIV